MLQRISVIIILTVAVCATHRWPVQSQTNLQRLTNTPEHSTNLNPTLSDNETVIVFESTADLAGTGSSNGFHALKSRVPIDQFAQISTGRLVCAGLSGDGSIVVFASTEDLTGENSDRNSEIYLLDHYSLSQITHTMPDSLATRLTDGNFQPDISTNGRFIVFSTTTRTLTNVLPGIVLFDRASTQFITVAETRTSAVMGNPKLSGDGSRVVFTSTSTADNQSSLFAFDTTTRQTRLLATHSGSAHLSSARSVNHDGSRVVFSDDSPSGQSQVYLFDERDNSIRQLTTLSSRAVDVPLNPTISGDGKRIAFATRRRVTTASDGSVELYVLDLPTGHIQQITNAPAKSTAEVVSSLNYDGSNIAFNFSRLLSGPVTNDDFANNSEIYLSAVADRPAFGSGEALNAAATESISSDSKTFAPDSLVNVRGNALSVVTLHSKLIAGRFPSSLGGVTASVNNQPVELIYVSPDEMTLVLPSRLSNGPTELVVTNAYGFQIRAPIVISNTAPGLFSFDTQSTGAVLDATRFVTAPLDPTNGNLRITVFATGLRHARSISAQLNGETVAVEQVAPSNVPGLDEIHLLVPASFRGVGSTTLSVVADEMSSNEVAFTISGSPVRDVLINEFLADPPEGPAGDANDDGTRSASGDEFVELVNTTTRDLNLAGFKLFTKSVDGAEIERHRFANPSIVSAGTAVVIFGGGNPDGARPSFGGALVLKASTGSLALSNSGGAIILKNALSETLCSVTYGPKVGLRADINQALTRSPDLVGSLFRFSDVSNALFSPGTRVDGSAFLANPAVSRVEVLAPGTQLRVGESMQVRAMAFDTTNSALGDVLFKWQSQQANIATIDSNGLVTALRAGSSNIVATARGVSSGAFQLTVSQPTPTPTPTPVSTPTPTPTATPSPSQTPTPLPSITPIPSPTPQPAGTAPVLISEFRTRGPNGASDEFVEIYNRTSGVIDISGWKIKGSNSSGSVATRVVIPANTLLPASCHYLATHATGYTGQISGDQTYSNGLVNDGGVALTLPNDSMVDQVGLSSGSVFKEGTHLAPLSADANQSYERKPGGSEGSTTDTDNNLSDFRLATSSDPQNRSSNPTPGPIPTPSPSSTPFPSPSPSPIATPTPSPSPTASPSPGASISIRITQIYGGGGNSGAPFLNDFIEIFNAGSVPVDLTGWSVQYASANGASWSVTALNSIVLSPGRHYLIQEASGGSNGVSLPSPDATGNIALAASAGKVALLRTNVALNGACPTNVDVVDFVGYGSTANCFRGSGPTPAPSNTNAIVRAANGCVDTQNNAADFALGPPVPRNTGASPTTCTEVNSSVLLSNQTWASREPPLLFAKARPFRSSDQRLTIHDTSTGRTICSLNSGETRSEIRRGCIDYGAIRGDKPP